MATRNQKIHKASWLGFKIDAWNALANLCYTIFRFAIAKKNEHENEQDELLDEIAMEDMSKDSNEA